MSRSAQPGRAGPCRARSAPAAPRWQRGRAEPPHSAPAGSSRAERWAIPLQPRQEIQGGRTGGEKRRSCLFFSCSRMLMRVHCKARLRPLQRCVATSLQEATGARLGRGRRVPPSLPPSHPCPSQWLPRRGRARQARALFRSQRRLHSPNAGQAGRGEPRGRGAGRRPPTHPRRDLVDGVAAGVAARLRHGVEAGQVGAALPRAQHPAPFPAAAPAQAEAAPGNAPPRPGGAGGPARRAPPGPGHSGAGSPGSWPFPEAAGMRPRCRGPDVAGRARRRRSPVPAVLQEHGRGGFTLGGD